MRRFILTVLFGFSVFGLVGCGATKESSSTTTTTTIISSEPSVNDVIVSANFTLSDGAEITAESVRFYQGTGSLSMTSGITVTDNSIYRTNIFGSEGTYDLGFKLSQGGTDYVWVTENVVVTAGVTLDFGDVMLIETGTANVQMTADIEGLGLSSIDGSFETTIPNAYFKLLEAPTLTIEQVDSSIVWVLSVQGPQMFFSVTANITGKKTTGEEVEYEPVLIEYLEIYSGIVISDSETLHLVEVTD